jgi:phage protein D
MADMPAIRVSRPSISIDGHDSEDLAGGLLGLLIEEDSGGLYRCEANFGNWGTAGSGIGFLYFDRETLDFGKPFAVTIGDDKVFEGLITAVEAQFPEDAAPTITVLVEDRLQNLRMTRRTRSFESMTAADMINQIASDHSLTPDVSLTDGQRAALAQVNQSDLAFLRTLARSIDAEIWVEGTTLFARSHADRDGGDVTLRYGSELREFSVIADLAHQRTKVTVSGWDVEGKSAINESADDGVIQNELDGGSSGASILQQALGARAETIAHGVPLDTNIALARAEAYFRQIARRFVVGRGLTDGDGRLRVGAQVDLEGLGALFNGKYDLTAVRHTFDDVRGIFTEFTAERAGLGQR